MTSAARPAKAAVFREDSNQPPGGRLVDIGSRLAGLTTSGGATSILAAP
jgi:hypothetical protein